MVKVTRSLDLSYYICPFRCSKWQVIRLLMTRGIQMGPVVYKWIQSGLS